MLARSAHGLYWMSRYLERAKHLCRLLRLQSEALVDRPIREIHLGWNRIYSSAGRHPPIGGIVILDNDDYMLADSYTLADDLTFERTNPDSVWSCFAAGRENARQMRQCISYEMWTSLNLAYLRIQEIAIQDIWAASPESFYSGVVAEIDTFSGVAADTMYRDEGWQFMQLGQVIERAQLLCALLLTQIEIDNTSEGSILMETGRACYGCTMLSRHTIGGTAWKCGPSRRSTYLPRTFCCQVHLFAHSIWRRLKSQASVRVRMHFPATPLNNCWSG